MYSRSRPGRSSIPGIPAYHPQWRANSRAVEASPVSVPAERVIQPPPQYSGNAFSDAHAFPRTAPIISNDNTIGGNRQTNAPVDFNAAYHDQGTSSDNGKYAPPISLGETARGMLSLTDEEASSEPANSSFSEPVNDRFIGMPRYPLYASEEEEDDSAGTTIYRRPRAPMQPSEQSPILYNSNGRRQRNADKNAALSLQPLLQGLSNLPAALGNLSPDEMLIGTIIVMLMSEGKDDLMVLLLMSLLIP